MKNFIIPLLCLGLFLTACGKKERADSQEEIANMPHIAQPSDILSEAQQQETQANGCQNMHAMFAACTPSSCIRSFNFFGTVVPMLHTIKGVEDKRCVYTQDTYIQNYWHHTLHCAFNKEQSRRYAEYTQILFNSSGNISSNVTVRADGTTVNTEIIDGQQVINPMNDFLSDGTCQAFEIQ